MNTKLNNTLIVALISVGIAACNSGGSGSSNSGTTPPSQPTDRSLSSQTGLYKSINIQVSPAISKATITITGKKGVNYTYTGDVQCTGGICTTSLSLPQQGTYQVSVSDGANFIGAGLINVANPNSLTPTTVQLNAITSGAIIFNSLLAASNLRFSQLVDKLIKQSTAINAAT